METRSSRLPARRSTDARAVTRSAQNEGISQTYKGKFGYSLNIKGLDKGVNNLAYGRRIIFHKMTNKPWSLGCFTVPQKKAKKLINLIKGGTLIYVAS